MSIDRMGDAQDGWRGSYDGWLAHDRRNDEPDGPLRTKPAERSPTAAQSIDIKGAGLTVSEAYAIAKRAVRCARDLGRDPIVKADWLALAANARGLARDLRAREIRRKTA